MKEIAKRVQAISSPKEGYMPTIEMRRFVAVLLDKGRGSVVETERLTKINRDKFWYQMRRAKDRQDFQRWYVRQVDDYLTSFEAPVAKALLSKIADQDIQALRLYYEIRGRLKSVAGVQVNTQLNFGEQANLTQGLSEDELDAIIEGFIGGRNYIAPEKCVGCVNEYLFRPSKEMRELEAEVKRILDPNVKDEELDIVETGVLVECLRRRPFWFRKIMNMALKDALLNEVENKEEAPCANNGPGQDAVNPCGEKKIFTT